MAVLKAKPNPQRIYLCYESFGSSDPLGGCAAGTRLKGDNPKVVKWFHFFTEDGASDEELRLLREKHYADMGAPPPEN
jgi:hypothetical protein